MAAVNSNNVKNENAKKGTLKTRLLLLLEYLPIPSPLKIWWLISPVKSIVNLYRKIMIVFSVINAIYGCIEIVTKPIKNLQATKKTNSHWFCIIYTKDFLLFSDLNNDEFIHTIKDKKVKITHVTKRILTAISI